MASDDAHVSDDLEPKRHALLAAVTSFGPITLLAALIGFQVHDFVQHTQEVVEPPQYFTSVAVTYVSGETYDRELQLTGQAVPEREVALRVADDAQVLRVPVRLGERVVTGQTICQLRYRGERGSVALTSPINGSVNALSGAPGSVLRGGSTCATIVDTSSMIVRTEIKQHQAKTVSAGDPVDLSISGQSRSAQVHYVHPDKGHHRDDLRTVEIRMNDLAGINVGDRATIEVRTQQLEATIVPQEALIMVPGRGLSVQIVQGDGPTGTVTTIPVEIVAATRTGIYVQGLPARARLIVNNRKTPPASEGETVRIGRIT